MSRTIAIIVAVDENWGIGKNGAIPWHCVEDLKHFRSLTEHNTVVMGRKTFESIGRPLPNRINVVVSKTMNNLPGIRVMPSLSNLPNDYGDIFLIGGSDIYRDGAQMCGKVYITRIKGNHNGDTFFPAKVLDDFYLESRQSGDLCVFEIWIRKSELL